MLFLFVTALAVSVDAFVAGLAYNLKRRMSIGEVLYAGLITFFMCFAALLLNKIVLKFLPAINLIGAIVFIFLGIRNFREKEEEKSLLNRNTTESSVCLLGLAVATDAAIACLMVEVKYALIVLYAFVMCVGHTLFLGISAFFVRLNGVKKPVTRISGVMLIAIGIFKLIYV